MTTGPQDCIIPTTTEVVDPTLSPGTVSIFKSSLVTATETRPIIAATWSAITNPYVTGIEFEYYPNIMSPPVKSSAPQAPGNLAWQSSDGVVFSGVYKVRVRAVGSDAVGNWSSYTTVTMDDAVPADSLKTFAQNDPPTAENVGDIWLDTNDDFHMYRWNGSSWISVRDGTIADAIAAASTAQATADGKVTTFVQTSPPTAEGIGDLWLDSDDGYHSYRWNGSIWVDIQDTDIGAGLSAAAAAQSTADGKIESFFQTSPPTANAVGDLWFDTDDGNKQYRWSGSAWISSQDGSIATAQTTADGKIKTFYASSAPTASTVGDIWFDTSNGNKQYRWSGSAWVPVQDQNALDAAAAAAAAASAASAQANTAAAAATSAAAASGSFLQTGPASGTWTCPASGLYNITAIVSGGSTGTGYTDDNGTPDKPDDDTYYPAGGAGGGVRATLGAVSCTSGDTLTYALYGQPEGPNTNMTVSGTLNGVSISLSLQRGHNGNADIGGSFHGAAGAVTTNTGSWVTTVGRAGGGSAVTDGGGIGGDPDNTTVAAGGSYYGQGAAGGATDAPVYSMADYLHIQPAS